MNASHLITLPAKIAAAAQTMLLAEAREFSHQGLAIDASALQSIGTQSVQFLIACAAECAAAGQSFRIIDPEKIVSAAIGRLGLPSNGIEGLE